MVYTVEHSDAFWEEQFGSPYGVPNWYFYSYEYIDELAFMPNARQVLGDGPRVEMTLDAVERELKRRSGWNGSGELQLLWLPDFVGAGPHKDVGCYAIHVKTNMDGISLIASPYVLPFHRLFQRTDSRYETPGVL